MKRLLLLLIIIMAMQKTNAQVMSAKAEWVTIKSSNLRCWECKDKLEKYLFRVNHANWDNGVIEFRFNLLNAELRAKYYPDRVTPDDIKTAMNNAGFDADEEKAEESVYKKLQPICKRPEEGGGPYKGKPCHIPPVE